MFIFINQFFREKGKELKNDWTESLWCQMILDPAMLIVLGMGAALLLTGQNPLPLYCNLTILFMLSYALYIECHFYDTSKYIDNLATENDKNLSRKTEASSSVPFMSPRVYTQPKRISQDKNVWVRQTGCGLRLAQMSKQPEL